MVKRFNWINQFLLYRSSQSVVQEKDEEEEKGNEQKEQHPLPVLTQHPILMQPSLADFKEV